MPVVRYKLIAFVLSAAMPGMVGGGHGPALDLLRGRSGVRSDDLGDRRSRWRSWAAATTPRGPVLGTVFLFTISELLWANAPLLYMLDPRARSSSASCCLLPNGIVGLFDRIAGPAGAPRRATPLRSSADQEAR